MSVEMQEKKKAKVIKANYVLQARIGAGPLDAKRIDACQKIIDENDIDFAPLASAYLDQLENAIARARSGEISLKSAVQGMTRPVMELKANAATFKYDLVTNLANVMLSFLEAVKSLDKTVLDIVSAHHRTLSIIILKKMKGDGGQHGKLLEQELKDACVRYFQKKKADADNPKAKTQP